jgi:hypothetical protein
MPNRVPGRNPSFRTYHGQDGVSPENGVLSGSATSHPELEIMAPRLAARIACLQQLTLQSSCRPSSGDAETVFTKQRLHSATDFISYDANSLHGLSLGIAVWPTLRT